MLSAFLMLKFVAKLYIMTKEYRNVEITIKWQAEKCKHAGVCVKMLPRVYNPKAAPWEAIENASTTELKVQISKCPSGALSYYENEAI